MPRSVPSGLLVHYGVSKRMVGFHTVLGQRREMLGSEESIQDRIRVAHQDWVLLSHLATSPRPTWEALEQYIDAEHRLDVHGDGPVESVGWHRHGPYLRLLDLLCRHDLLEPVVNRLLTDMPRRAFEQGVFAGIVEADGQSLHVHLGRTLTASAQVDEQRRTNAFRQAFGSAAVQVLTTEYRAARRSEDRELLDHLYERCVVAGARYVGSARSSASPVA